MKLNKIYPYLFYKLYRWYENRSFAWLSDWKASFVIIVLEIWIIVSFLIYYKLFFNPEADIIGKEIIWGGMVLALSLIDYLVFHTRNQWKNYVKEFDRLSTRTNRIGGWIVFGVITLITVNFIFSFYLYYQT
nr:hypothetical protein [uncultured Fluviicola sp.]